MEKKNIKIAQVTLSILKNKNWQKINTKEIKDKCKIKSFDEIIKNEQDLLKLINEYFDFKLSINSEYIEKSSNKDMIFEVIMMRFDILQDYRKSVISIYSSFKKKPKNLILLLPHLIDSIILMLSYAKFSTKGIFGQIKIKAILIIYISTFLVWIKDESDSLEKTMTALDNYLDYAGKILKLVSK